MSFSLKSLFSTVKKKKSIPLPRCAAWVGGGFIWGFCSLLRIQVSPQKIRSVMLTKWCRLGSSCQSAEGFHFKILVFGLFYVAPVLPTASIRPQVRFDKAVWKLHSWFSSIWFYLDLQGLHKAGVTWRSKRDSQGAHSGHGILSSKLYSRDLWGFPDCPIGIQSLFHKAPSTETTYQPVWTHWLPSFPRHGSSRHGQMALPSSFPPSWPIFLLLPYVQ